MDTAEKFLRDLDKTPEAPFIIDQLLPDNRQAFSIICGRPEIGKTNLALYLAFCLALGKPFFSFKTEQKKTGYLFMESGTFQIGTRVRKLANHFREIPPKLHIQPIDPTPLTPIGYLKLAELIAGLEVLIIDPLKFLIPGDYMKPTDVMKALTTLLKLQNDFSFTSILIGHIRKPPTKGIEDPDDYWTNLKGPTEYLEMANSALMLTKPRHSRDNKGHFSSNQNDRQLHFIKSRDASRELEHLNLRFDRETLIYLPLTEDFEEAEQSTF